MNKSRVGHATAYKQSRAFIPKHMALPITNNETSLSELV